MLIAPTVTTMIWMCGLVAKLRTWPKLAGVVEEVVEGHVGVKAAEVLSGDLERLVNAFLDRHGGTTMTNLVKP